MSLLGEAYVAGYGCLAARASLLDRINVYPVADGDTGTNLRISLAPLQNGGDGQTIAARLKWTATGNSGNIAAAFFTEFLSATKVQVLAGQAEAARLKARGAVGNPREGTMLSVFDRLAVLLAQYPLEEQSCLLLLRELRQVVLTTTQQLPELRAAGVVDAGALGIYLFFDGFLRQLTGYADDDLPLDLLFPGSLAIAEDYRPKAVSAYCVDLVLRPATGRCFGPDEASLLGDSVVVVSDSENVKLHIHTPDPWALREQLAQHGKILSWSDELMAQGPEVNPVQRGLSSGSLHIMTDAAGSLSRDLAQEHGITLLDSYVVKGGLARPESCCDQHEIYGWMRQGEKITTAQASQAERYQSYRTACEEQGPTLYLAVGSAFTGNFHTARTWQKDYDEDGLFTVLDTGAASGRLAVIALLTARFGADHRGDETLERAHQLALSCREYIFIDALRYLVAGGRVSRAGGFFGDLLHLKPVISPTRAGAIKVGMVRNSLAQLDFAEKRLSQESAGWGQTVVLLQFSDNEKWVFEVVRPRISAIAPEAEIIVQPLSLTSGVHMGPGTWAIAFGPAS